MINYYDNAAETDCHIRFGSGDVFIGFTEFLAHRVAPWTAKANKAEEQIGVTAGRFSVVHFFHQKVLEQLKGKRPGWGISTNFGRWLDQGPAS